MIFSSVKIGPLTLRNRTIRAAAFEGMAQHHTVSQQLIDYHAAVAKGEIGMTTVAYAAIQKSGLSFPHQLWMREEIIPDLQKLTAAIHQYEAAASVQIGHCGNMAKHSVIGGRPISASTHFNMYAPSFPKGMDSAAIRDTVRAFGKAVTIAREGGFDAVEVHAGHGYLISQFLSPATNKRKDEFGGSLENRMRFMTMVMEEVLSKAENDIAVLVKMNMRDGFSGGMEIKESLEVAKRLQAIGAHALILSSGFVSRAPMAVMRGKMPVKTLSEHVDNLAMRLLVRVFGNMMIPQLPFKENYFLDDAIHFREALSLPLVYVGGVLSEENMKEVLGRGFDAVAIARALIRDTDFVAKIKNKQLQHSACDTCNHCIAVMYNSPFVCIQQLNSHEKK